MAKNNTISVVKSIAKFNFKKAGIKYTICVARSGWIFTIFVD